MNTQSIVQLVQRLVSQFFYFFMSSVSSVNVYAFYELIKIFQNPNSD